MFGRQPSFAPPELGFVGPLTHGFAVGFILAPLRGW